MIRSAAFAVLLVLAAAAPAAGQPRAEREQARLETLREQRAALERKLKATESSRSAVADRLRDTEQAISATGRRLHALATERGAARAELHERERELGRLERQVAARQAQLGRLLRYQFQPQRADAMSILLAGGDPNLAARDSHFLSLLAQAQADLIAGLRRDAGAQRQLAAEIKERGEKLTELSRREEQERATLRQRQQDRQAVLDKLSGEIRQRRQQIATLKADEERLGSLIASLAKRARATRPAAEGRRKPVPEPAPAHSVAADPLHAGGAFAKLRGKLPRPVAGAASGRFGARRGETSVWKGLFFRAEEGAPVRAVAGGVVVFADWLRGYGNLLIIDHDDDFLSVYGNNQALLADAGQKVGAGATVATVGASGGQAESGLYFELRHQGRAFDPARWLGAQ